MSDILLMDNFSSLGPQESKLDASPWARMRYSVIGKGLLAVLGITDNRTGLRITAPTTEVTSHGLASLLPNEFTRFGTGFQVRSFTATTRASAQFGVGSIENGVFRSLMLIEVVSRTLLYIHYVDGNGTAQSVSVPLVGNGTFYLDYTFNKVSNVPNQMSNMTMAINNVTVVSGDYFNNGGTNLAIVHQGAIGTALDLDGPFLNKVDANGEPKTIASGSYNMGDLWVTRNGRRYGKAVVSRTQSSGTVGMLANYGDPLDLINQTYPNIDRNVYGKRLSAAFTHHPEASASQLTALIQRNSDSVENATLEFGTVNDITVGPELELVRVTNDGAPAKAELRIES